MLKKRCVLSAMLALLVTVVVFGQTPSAPREGAQPSYPGVPPSQGKVETDIGAFKVRFYGTVLLNLSVADAGGLADLPCGRLPSGRSGPRIPTARRPMGLTTTTASCRCGRACSAGPDRRPNPPPTTRCRPVWSNSISSARAQSTRPCRRTWCAQSAAPARTGYSSSNASRSKLLFGQDHMISRRSIPSRCRMSPPRSAQPPVTGLVASQIRGRVTTTSAARTGCSRPDPAATVRDPRLEAAPAAASTSVDVNSSGLGERSTQPFYQARSAVSPQIRGNKEPRRRHRRPLRKENAWITTIVLGGSTASTLSSRRLARRALRGEAFTGSNLIPVRAASTRARPSSRHQQPPGAATNPGHPCHRRLGRGDAATDDERQECVLRRRRCRQAACQRSLTRLDSS